MKHKERITLVRDTPVEKKISEVWQHWMFPQGGKHEISNRQVNFYLDDPDPRYQFELWDDEGFIGAYRIKIKVWNDNVKMLINEEAAQ